MLKNQFILFFLSIFLSFTAWAHGHGGSPKPPQGWDGKCPGYDVVEVPMEWTGPENYYSSGFGVHTILVAYFDTPEEPKSAPTSGKGEISVIGSDSTNEYRAGSLSTTPCDLSDGIEVFNSEEPLAYFTFGYEKKGFPQLQPSTRYYMNMINATGCQPGPDCDVRLTFAAPPGTY